MTTTVGRVLSMALGLRLIQASLRLRGFQPTMRSLQWLIERAKGDVFDGTTRWVAEINHVATPIRPASCLDKSVFLWFLMRQRGLDGRIRIGVAFDPERRLDGHAWVEFEGRVVNDAPDFAQRFAVFAEDPVGLVFS